MLARKYDNYAWEEIEYERPVERVRKVKKVDYKLVRRRAAVLVLLVMVAYFAAVARSESLVRTGDELVAQLKADFSRAVSYTHLTLPTKA